jgi:hypothetical protein
VVLGVLLLAVLSLGPDVFPERPCENLPEAAPEVKAWLAGTAPELTLLRVRELGEETVLEAIRRASASGWGSMEFFANVAFREPCTLYLSREALRSVDTAFDLDLLTPVRGKDKRGNDFEMTAALAGRGRLLLFYDRDGIVYRNERENRDFKLASRVEFDAPGPELLQNVRGLWARVLLFGWLGIRSIVKDGEKLEVRAGTFTSEFAPKPIQARKDTARSAR